MFWAVWKIDNGPEMEKAPDYVVFNIFKDENQQKLYEKLGWRYVKKKD